MRRKDASTNSFRRLLNELAMLMTYEVTRDVGMQEIEIETPLETTKAKVIDGKKLVFVSILRRHRHSRRRHAERGARRPRRPHRLYRDPKTLTAVEYYFRCRATWRTATWSSSIRCWRPVTRPSPPSNASRRRGRSRSSSSAC